MSDAPGGPGGLGDTADFVFTMPDFDSAHLKVLAFEGSEGISELFRFRVELASDDPSVDLSACLGKPAALEITAVSGAKRFVHGLVRRFERMGHGSGLTYYVAEIVPSLWLLTKRYQSRIFQEARLPDMTIPGLISDVFASAGLPTDYFDPMNLDASYDPARELVAQYRETDFDFISRWMEHEGLFYFFEHSAQGHRMAIADNPSAHAMLPDDAEFPYRDPSGLVEEKEYVFSACDRREIQHGSVFLDDFNFRKSHSDMWMRSHTAGDKNTALVYSDYPGCFAEKQTGDRYARVRLEENNANTHVVNFSATVRTLLPGYRFTLIDHPTQEMNRAYLVTHISHRARQSQSAQQEAGNDGITYEAQVRAIPAVIPYRAPRKTQRPVVIGSQTAVVEGPDGEEIYTDDEGYGRVKVQFHWDRGGDYPDNASCWVRCSQGWAGGGYGMLFLPRVGQEVIVDFLEGNPDRPIITGRVYNNDNMPPYLPDSKTISTIKTNSSVGGAGSNEIRFDDAKDAEQLLFHAQKDLHLRVKNDRVENVEHDRHLTVAGNKTEKVQGDRNLTVEGNLKEAIQADVSTDVAGKVSEHVAGTLSLTVDGDVVEALGANHKHEVAQTYAVSGANIKLEATTEIELVCGSCSIQLTSAGLFIAGQPLLNLNSGTGPPVAPVTAQATTPEAPDAPIDADEVEFGQDTTYAGEQREFDQVEAGAVAAGTLPPERVPVETTWIEIELINEADEPVPGERYELLLPDGKTRTGSLDANGKAHVDGLEPGTCQICFPRLDAEAWERI